MPVAIIKNLSFQTNLYLTAEVSRTKQEGSEKSNWFVEVTLALPSDKAPYSKKRVPFPNSEEALIALQELVTQLNELEPSQDDEDDEDEDEDEGDEEYEGDDEEV